MKITGPKTDIWLVKTIGVLVSTIAISITSAIILNEVSYSIAILGLLSAIGLSAIEVFYVFKGVIWKIYLLDVILELVFIVNWSLFLLS